MTAQTEFRPIPGHEQYEINRQGILRRRIRGSIKNTRPVGKPIAGCQVGNDRFYTLGHFGPRKTARSLLILTFGPDAVEPWRYHILTHPELKIHKGEDNGAHVLTAEQVLEIRERYASGGWSHRGLAREFGVCRSTINQILHHRTWRHV